MLALFLDHGVWLFNHSLLGNSGGDYRGGMANTGTCVRKISKCLYLYYKDSTIVNKQLFVYLYP
jgi:hypothetical protein